MEVEFTGAVGDAPKKNDKGEVRENRGLMWILGGFGVLIVGLIIAIVVVKNLPQDEMGNTNEEIEISESFDEYENALDNIGQSIEDDREMSDEEILDLYRTRIDNADNEEARSMISMDYYLILMSRDSYKQDSDGIINGLLQVDEVLHNYNSANALSRAYYYYGNIEQGAKYEALVEERLEDSKNE